jgi:hypothetical protein
MLYVVVYKLTISPQRVELALGYFVCVCVGGGRITKIVRNSLRNPCWKEITYNFKALQET